MPTASTNSVNFHIVCPCDLPGKPSDSYTFWTEKYVKKMSKKMFVLSTSVEKKKHFAVNTYVAS